MDKKPATTPADPTSVPMQFDARVEPFWLWRKKNNLGFFAAWKKKRRMQAIVRAIREGLAAQDVEAGDWDQGDGEVVCNLRMDRLGVLQDLRLYAAGLEKKSATEIYQGESDSRFAHLIKNRDRDAYYLPIDFPDPLLVLEHETKEFLPVGSAPRLLRELAELNKELRMEKTWKLKAMVDFFQAGEGEIRQFELRFGNDPNFWMKFGFVMLQKLAKKCVETKLPVIFS